jgi:hypothetical protein
MTTFSLFSITRKFRLKRNYILLASVMRISYNVIHRLYISEMKPFMFGSHVFNKPIDIDLLVQGPYSTLIDWLFTVLHPASESFTHRRSWLLSREGSFSRNTCCDTGHRFFRSHPKDRSPGTAPYNRLLRNAKGCWGPILIRNLTGQFFIVISHWIKTQTVFKSDTFIVISHLSIWP